MYRTRWIAVLFATAASLAACVDVASAEHSVIQHVSNTPAGSGGVAGGQQRVHITPDGNTAFFVSSAPLTADDTDDRYDVFRRSGDTVTRLSLGPTGGNGSFDAFMAPGNYLRAPDSITPDGQTVVFSTTEQLTADDTDATSDIYKRTGNTTTLVSIGPNGENGPCATGMFGGACNEFFGLSDDGRHVFFRSGGHLVAGDEESAPCGFEDPEENISDWWPCTDGYVNSDGVAELVTSGPGDTREAVDHEFAGMSPGGKAYFNTRAQLLPGQDTDTNGQDVYEWSAGALSLATPESTSTFNYYEFLAVSDDGTRLFYDTGSDFWERDPSGPDILRTPGTPQDPFFRGISDDGDHLYLSTPDALDPDDTDVCFSSGCPDLYEQTSAGYQRMTVGGTGNYNGGMDVQGATPDGDRAYLITNEPLTSQDVDTKQDLYEFESATGAVQLVSTGFGDPGASQPGSNVELLGVSDDGTRVFFLTDMKLLGTDGNGNDDIYERAGGATYILTIAPTWNQGLECCRPIEAVAADGSKVFWTTNHPMLASDTNSLSDVYSVSRGDLSGYPRPAGATPLRVALVPAFEPCTSPNRVHGPPLAFGSCAPPASRTQYLTVGVGDGSPAFAKSIGYVRFRALPGVPGGADDTDVRIELSLTNVMWQSGLSDYAGRLRGRIDLRRTDKEGVVPSTTQDLPFTFDVQCAATADTTIGGTCTLNTTADAITPGLAPEASRAIWALGRVEVLDGGADGNPATTPVQNGVLATQGVFVP